MTLYDRVLAETVRAYGYPAELRKGAVGVSATGGFGGMWLTPRLAPPPRNGSRLGTPNRYEARRGFRDLLEMLREQPDLEPWRPWCRWLKESAR